MKLFKISLKDSLFMILVLAVTFGINLVIHRMFHTQTLIPMIFVLGVFVIARQSENYLPGIAASLISVFAVNYAFTVPYYEFDMLTPVCLFSAVIMLIITVMTSMLTTKIKSQQKARTEIEKERIRSNLLGGISHDLRTPLTSIYGSTCVIIENYDSLKKEQHLKLLKEVREDSEWLIRMVENLLSVTKIDGDNISVVKMPVVLEELIDAILLKFKKRWEGQKLDVKIPGEFIVIPMDPLLIEQVIMNLLENAMIHATGMTELSLTVNIEGKKAVFEVADNGCGIPEERIVNLFKGNTEQSCHADSHRHSMGIGLMICDTIIKAHDGKISASNRQDGGAIFRFWLETEE